MSTAAQRSMAARLARHFSGGATVTLRRRHSLKSQRKGTPAVSGLLLLVNGAHLAGVSVIDLRADLLTGTLPAGCKFTIAGNATEYTVGADSTVAGGVLTDVAITPVLAANAADAAVVTITLSYVDYAGLPVLHSDVEGEISDAGEQESRRVLHLPYTSAVTPDEKTDHLIVDGRQHPIAAVREVNAGGGVVRWALVIGRAAA